MVDDASTRSDVYADVSAYTMTTAEAAAILGRSEGTVRRLIRDGVLPAVQVTGGRTTEYRLREEDVHDVHAHMNAYASKHQRSHERVDASDASPRDARPVRLDPAAGVQAIIDQAVRSAVEPLTAEISRLNDVTRQQAEELGRERALREASERELAVLRALLDVQEDTADIDNDELLEDLSEALSASERHGAAPETESPAPLSLVPGEPPDAGVADLETAALWAQLAQAVQAGEPTIAHQVVEPAPAPRRGFWARLLRRG